MKTTEEFAVPSFLVTKGYRIYALTLQCVPIWDWFRTIQIGCEEANLIGKDFSICKTVFYATSVGVDISLQS